MIGLDSNVLVRYLLRDDPEWTDAAIRCIDDECTPERPGHINIIALIEIIWALQYAPGYDRRRLVEIINGFLNTDNLVIEDEAVVSKALESFRMGKADFADCLILALNERANATPTMTLDQTAAKEPGFQRLLKKKIRG